MIAVSRFSDDAVAAALTACGGGGPVLDSNTGTGGSTGTAKVADLSIQLTSSTLVNSGTATVGTTNSEISPNLDIRLELYDSSGTLVATSDPPTTAFNFDIASGATVTLSNMIASPVDNTAAGVRKIGVGTLQEEFDLLENRSPSGANAQTR